MTQEQQVGHQKVLFETLLDAIEFREYCPLCNGKLSLTCSTGAVRVYEKHVRSYIIAIRNITNTEDFIRVWADGKTAELFTSVAIKGQDGVFHFPINMTCKECNSYKHSFRIAFNLITEPGTIVEVKMVSVMLRLSEEDGMVLRTYFYPCRTELILNDKTYELDFVNIDPFKSKELYERFSSIVPFI